MPSAPDRLVAAATWGRLQTLVAVLETGSVRAAAERLQVSAPAVSAAIAALESELSVRLFRKAGRGIVPTSAGTTFGEYARTLLGLIAEGAAAARAQDRAMLRIGAVATASEFVLPPLLASFVRAHPDVEVSLSVGPRDALFTQLRHHEVDLVLAGRPPRGSSAGLVTKARRANRLIVVATPEYVATQRDPRDATWLIRSAGSGTLEATRSVLVRLGGAPATLTLGTHGAVVAAAREGLGLTLVHADAVAVDLAEGRLVHVAVDGTPLDRPWHVVANKNAPHVVGLFVRHLTDSTREAAAFTR